MVIEYNILLDGTSHTVIVSDERSALLAAKAAGRAVIGVEGNGNQWTADIARYVIPCFGDASVELAQLALRRHLGLPWEIAVTERLIIREFVKTDGCHIPEEEYSCEESIFRSQELLEHYIEKQYGFYEYGTWALTDRSNGLLIGMAGVSNPRLPAKLDVLHQVAGSLPWLELGYHIFRPFRRRGYALEAVKAVRDYTHEVLEARLCALVRPENLASRAVAESLDMECINGTDTQSSKGLLLYVENWTAQPDRADS